jgi:dTDP-4-amino-4,6-dideoxygalactose transaminase
MAISILRPRLPTTEALKRYLNRIDQRRIYSNFGPLVRELEQRLAERVDLSPSNVVTAANATLALTAALLAQCPRAGSFCLMPAWTFVASPLAALAAGLVPFFVDVAPDDWLLRPAAVAEIAASMAGDVSAVMPVAAFGQPVDVGAWDDFRHDTGLAVVIDSAAGFDAMQVGDVPNVVSLHATKALGAGEGGFVASRDIDLVRRIQTYLAFGFSGSREALVPGFNGKMSEYHAAVGLAALDGWDEARKAFVARARTYARAFHGSNIVRLQPGFGDRWVASTCVVKLPDGMGDRVANHLAAASIDSRHWWGRGAQTHPATRALPRGGLDITASLAVSTLGLPFYVDIPLEQVDRVAEEVLASFSSRRHAKAVR